VAGTFLVLRTCEEFRAQSGLYKFQNMRSRQILHELSKDVRVESGGSIAEHREIFGVLAKLSVSAFVEVSKVLLLLVVVREMVVAVVAGEQRRTDWTVSTRLGLLDPWFAA
jgi:hypothetical protein